MVTLAILLFVVISSTQASYYFPLCQSFGNDIFYSFTGTQENVRIPCKYPAVRDSRCGNYSITLTPGNTLDSEGKRFVPETLWLRVEDLNTGLRYEGWTSHKKASRWITAKRKQDPYVQNDGQLNFKDLFSVFSHGEYVNIVEKTGSFSISYYLYKESSPKTHSGFAFLCMSDVFQPTAYPRQLCGDRTANAVLLNKKEMGHDDRKVTLIYNIFMDMSVIQKDANCRTTAKTLSSKACNEKSYEVTQTCSPIFTDREIRESIVASNYSVRSTFMHCTEYLCRKDKDACLSLSSELGSVPNLKASIIEGGIC